MLLRFMVAVSAFAMLVGCVSAADVASIPLRDMLYGPPGARTLIVVEDAGVLPATAQSVDAGVSFNEVDLATSRNVMVGYNHAWLSGHDLKDGELQGQSSAFVDGSPELPYEIFSAPGKDYALTGPYRSDGVWVDVICYDEAAIVYHLTPGAINYIPTELQPPQYDGLEVRDVDASRDIGELRRVLARFPISQMEIVVPQVVAVISYEFRGGPGEGCRTSEEFRILVRHDLLAK